MPEKGTLNISLSFLATGAHVGHAEGCPDINGPRCAETPAPPEWHDLKLFFGELRLHAEYSFLRWLSLDLLWSFRVVRVDFQLQDAATRMPITPPYGEEIHHRSETLSGVTDPWLSFRAVKQLGHWAFSFRAGFTLPVGNTVENPFALGRAGKEHQHIQFGTGTFDPFVGLEVRRGIGHFSVTGWLLGKASLYENSHQYQAGSQLMGGLKGGSDLWTRSWWFMLGALVYHEQPEHWSGVTETEGNLGRTDVMLDTSITWRFVGTWSLTLGGRIPLWTRAVGAQLNTPAIGELTLAHPFDLSRRSQK